MQNELFVPNERLHGRLPRCVLDEWRTMLTFLRRVVERKQNLLKYPCENLCLNEQKRGNPTRVVYGTVVATIIVRGDPVSE